jgi:uncharacterized protein YjiS (DUF1127 family)
MSAHTADTRFSFELPKLSYIDAKWEEPNLRAPVAVPAKPHGRSRPGWLSHPVAAFLAWRRDSQAAAELSQMSDRELLDIGLTRADITRVFDPAFNQDLLNRA